MKRLFLFSTMILALMFGMLYFFRDQTISIKIERTPEEVPKPTLKIVSVDLQKQNLRMFSKNDAGEHYGTFEALKMSMEAEGGVLTFATNGGIFQEDLTPLGLYIEDGETIKSVNLVKEAFGNFYMQPNGVLYLQDKAGGIIPTDDIDSIEDIQFATQSGPMLLVNGEINPLFNPESKNRTTRNGVCFPEPTSAIFIIASYPITFYKFASAFLEQGCANALYLDGAISTMYSAGDKALPFAFKYAVIIGVIE